MMVVINNNNIHSSSSIIELIDHTPYSWRPEPQQDTLKSKLNSKKKKKSTFIDILHVSYDISIDIQDSTTTRINW